MKRGLVDSYIPTADRTALCKRIAEALSKDSSAVAALCRDFKREVDQILTFIDSVWGKPITLATYQSFWEHIEKYYPLHITNKYAPDYLSAALLDSYLPLLEEARVYAEPVFKRTEEFLALIAVEIGKREGIKPELVLCTLKEEFENYLAGGLLPPATVLAERYKHSVLLFTPTERFLFVGAEAEAVEAPLINVPSGDLVKGTTAYPGKVTGIARLVFDPSKAAHFGAGDILISPMTRPEFLALMKQAAAFVTDGGGILCHAAIVARELKKPCVIGTQIATRVFKDGDKVEVDATQGVIRKI